MAPVIRISDDAFRRLQRFSEPLVDTPSSVIERVLDHYEATQGDPSAADTSVRGKRSETDATRLREGKQFVPPLNVFLVPTTEENLRRSIEKPVPLQLARSCLSSDQFKALSDAIAPASEFRCWATNESNKNLFVRMNAGDRILFTQKGTGKFNYIARIRAKLTSEPLAQRIWPVLDGLPWKHIYVVDDLQPIDVSKERLVTALGYDRTFWVPGHIRVNPLKLQAAIVKHESLELLLEACQE